jgi:hypothetical protein
MRILIGFDLDRMSDKRQLVGCHLLLTDKLKSLRKNKLKPPLFAGWEGDPVPAASQTLTERGQGPLPYLQVFPLRGLF